MKLNKIMLATVVAFGISSVAHAANQGTGTVRFEGSIIDAPCSISADTINQTVQLGQVSSAALAKGGQSTPVSFDIKLENCDINTKKSVRTTFNGAVSGVNSDLLGITGTAQGAGVAISYGGTPVKLNTFTQAQNLNEGNNILQFAAYLQGESDDAVITPGNFYAVANFALDYQ